jgi:sugar phosphate isomerase/epimerase
LAGAAPECDIDATRAMLEEGIEQIIPDAEQSGAKLSVEPLHPVFAAERSAFVTLSRANDMLDRLVSPQVGVSIDVYHVWWDPDLYAQIDRAAGRILGFHIIDWPVPNEYPLMSRAMMGDGVIELRRIRSAVDEAGYTGPIEVEIVQPSHLGHARGRRPHADEESLRRRRLVTLEGVMNFDSETIAF